jgi:hypothetical protein
MKEMFYCPGCGEAIDMTHAICSTCGTDISALTGVKKRGSSSVRPLKDEDITDKDEEVDEEEDVEKEEEVEEEEDVEERPVKAKNVPAQKKGGAFGRWFKRLLMVGIAALGIWAYQQVGGIEGLQKMFSADGNPITEQTTVESYSDINVNSEAGKSAVTMDDFAGDWNPESLNPGSTDRMASEHIIIRRDGAGTMVIYFIGYENAADLLNYRWGTLKGRQVQCAMSYKDNAENVGIVLLELSADKNMLSYSTLDGATSKVMNTHKFQRVR